MKSSFKSTILVTVFAFSVMTVPAFGQETAGNSITDLIKNTANEIKNMASEVANNTTGIISPSEAKNILNQLGEASRQVALSGTDVLANITGEIKEGLK